MLLPALCAAWLLGLGWAALTGDLPWPAAAGLAVAGPAAALLERRPRLALLGAFAAALVLVGGWRYVDSRPPATPAGIALHNDAARDVRFRALVVDEPEVRGRSQRVRLDAREVLLPSTSLRTGDGRWRPTTGGVLMRRGLFPRHRYGDLIEVSGRLETPPSFPGFDYREHLALRGVVSLVDYPEVRTLYRARGNRALAAVHDVRRTLGDALGRALPEPEASLAQGIVLGQRSAISPALTDDLNATGTSHLVAVSGYNVNLVAGLVIAALAWLIGRRQAAVVALVAIAGYTVLTGASPSVVRAAIMGGLFVLATLAGRPASAGAAVALAAAAMTAWHPLVVRDVSFQLSFAAVLGLIYLAPPLHRHATDLARGWGVEPDTTWPAALAIETSTTTLAAVAATLPLTALNFDRLSPVTFLANLFLAPAFPLILASSALAAGAGVLWEPLGLVTGWLAYVPLAYMVEAARLFAGLPLASFDIAGFGRAHAAVLYAALAALAWLLARPPSLQRRLIDAPRAPSPLRLDRLLDSLRAPRPPARQVQPPASSPQLDRRLPPLIALLSLAAATAMVSWLLMHRPPAHLELTVLDVGQGDAVFVQTPNGRQLLIDGGPSGRAALEALGRRMPFWDRTLDLVVLSHPQQDHLAGLVDVLDRYDVRAALVGPPPADRTAAYVEWRRALDAEGISPRVARAGDRIDLGGGATLRVLGPTPELAGGDTNDASLVLKLEWGRVGFLLAGDIERPGEQALLSAYDGADLRAAVLKVAHHGSATSTTPAFVSAVRPSIAVVSAGRGNPFGHPSRQTLDRLAGALLLRTDRQGDVTFSTDGERLWLDR